MLIPDTDTVMSRRLLGKGHYRDNRNPGNLAKFKGRGNTGYFKYRHSKEEEGEREVFGKQFKDNCYALLSAKMRKTGF